jgi:hypothetical protein
MFADSNLFTDLEHRVRGIVGVDDTGGGELFYSTCI